MNCDYNRHMDHPCSAKAKYRVEDRHGERFGMCEEHTEPIIAIMAEQSPLTVEPIFSQWPVSA